MAEDRGGQCPTDIDIEPLPGDALGPNDHQTAVGARGESVDARLDAASETSALANLLEPR